MSKVYLLMAKYENDEPDEQYDNDTEVLRCYERREDCIEAIYKLTLDDFKDSKRFKKVVTDVDYSYLDEKYTKDNCINPDCIKVIDIRPRRGSRIIRLDFEFFNKWERVEKVETIGYVEFWCKEMDIIEKVGTQ